MKFPWHKAPDLLRPLVLGNLERLQRLFRARGKRLEFNPDSPTAKLEDALWNIVDQTAADMGLTFPPGMPCESRITDILKHLDPMPYPGSGRPNQWPAFLQQAR